MCVKVDREKKWRTQNCQEIDLCLCFPSLVLCSTSMFVNNLDTTPHCTLYKIDTIQVMVLLDRLCLISNSRLQIYHTWTTVESKYRRMKLLGKPNRPGQASSDENKNYVWFGLCLFFSLFLFDDSSRKNQVTCDSLNFQFCCYFSGSFFLSVVLHGLIPNIFGIRHGVNLATHDTRSCTTQFPFCSLLDFIQFNLSDSDPNDFGRFLWNWINWSVG